VIHLTYASLHETECPVFAQTLAEVYERYPRRKIGIRADQPTLQRILSMPLWKRRHELYAVWIATEIVNALSDHHCQLNHEDGRITFSFRESLVATVHTARPKIRLYAERRSPLMTPVGQSRKANVQPDYGLWRGTAPLETCPLVIEVKHYKRGSASRFRDVLIDYARAHLHAQVVLVCHGPADESVHQLDPQVRDRCIVIAELTANHLDQRERFRKVVRECVGEPRPKLIRDFDADTIVAIDHRALFSAALGPEGFPQSPDRERLAMVSLEMAHKRLEDILEAHTEVRLSALNVRYIHPRDDGSHLRLRIAELLEENGRVLLVTNCVGVTELENVPIELIHSELIHSSELSVFEVSTDSALHN
jgi:hypothetical protein